MSLLYSGQFWALAAGLLWAVAVILFKRSGESIPPPVLNLFKGCVALLLVFLPIHLFQGVGGDGWTAGDWGLVVLSGLLGITLADTLFFMALNRLGAGMNAIVDCVYAPAMVTMAMLYLGEMPTAAELGGGALILVAILVGSATKPAPGRTRKDLTVGIVLGLLGMVVMSASVVMIKYLFVPEHAVAVTTWRLATGTAFLFATVLCRRKWRESFLSLARPSAAWKIAIPGSLLGAGFAMLAWIAGFTYCETITPAAMLNQFSTIYIFVLATVVLKEPMTRRRVAAFGLAIAGAMIVILG
ncbi:MAG: DMT family transporter [Planctomycetota bacterium]